MRADPSVAETARASFERCCRDSEYLAGFYRNFFRVCPAAEPYFARTDFERQRRLLKHAIGLMLIYPLQQEGSTLLDRIAERHSRSDLAIPPELYSGFVDALVATASEFDPEFDEPTGAAWRAAVAPAVAYITARY